MSTAIRQQYQKEIAEAATVAQGIMDANNGTPKELNADDRQTWQNAVDKADALRLDLQRLETLERINQMVNAEVPETGLLEAKNVLGINVLDATRKVYFGDVINSIANRFGVPKNAAYDKEVNAIREQAKANKMDGLISAANASAGTSAAGGAMVLPLIIANEIIRLIEKVQFVRRYSRRSVLETAASLGYVKVVDFDSFEWRTENQATTAQDVDQFSRIALTPYRCGKHVIISRELMSLASNAEEEFMFQMLRMRRYTEENGFLTGDGSAKPLGVHVASSSGVSTARRVSAIDTVVPDDLIKVVAKLEGGYRDGARWLLHRNMEARVRLMKDDNGNFMFNMLGHTGSGLIAGMSGTLLGFPVDISEFMTDPGLVDADFPADQTVLASLQNWGAGYRIVDTPSLDMIIDMKETYATTNQVGAVYQFYTGGVPYDEKAFAVLEAESA